MKKQLDEAGEIVGPELAFNSSPPLKVYHPKAGVGDKDDAAGDSHPWSSQR